MPYTARLGRQIMAPVSAPARDRLPGRRVKRLSTGLTGLVVPAIVFVWPNAAAPRWFEHERHGGSVLILPDLANDNYPRFGSSLQPLSAAPNGCLFLVFGRDFNGTRNATDSVTGAAQHGFW